jgi:hypothetical protein
LKKGGASPAGDAGPVPDFRTVAGDKSLLVLFFRKEHAFCLNQVEIYPRFISPEDCRTAPMNTNVPFPQQSSVLTQNLHNFASDKRAG